MSVFDLPSWTTLAGALSVVLLPLGYYALIQPRLRHGSGSDDPPSFSGRSLPSVLAPAYTTHARLLPTPSKHAFSYLLLYLGADVDDLEAGALDLPCRVFRYGGTMGRVLGMRSEAYLLPDATVKPAVAKCEDARHGGDKKERTPAKGLRQKVLDLLEGYEIGSELVGRIWVLTMPSLLGFEGINPLTVWYIYKATGSSQGGHAGTEKDGAPRELLAIILEVHNTFGEKHAYVLPSSSFFIVPPKDGYSHAWTFPRGFHVSPFNSRDGFYTLDLLDPFLSPSASPYPDFKVFLRLLTPSRQTKLHALLASSPSPSAAPIFIRRGNEWAVLRTLLRWPVALIATTPRILYQAYRLHYERKLAMYPRPEPGPAISARKGAEHDTGATGLEERQAPGGEVDAGWKEPNDPNPLSAQSGRAIGWQGLGSMEQVARGVVESHLRGMLARRGDVSSVRVQFTYPATDFCLMAPVDSTRTDVSGVRTRDIVIRTADQKFFTHLLLLPSNSESIISTLLPELGTHVEPDDMRHFLTAIRDLTIPEPAGACGPLTLWLHKLIIRIQRSYAMHLFAHSIVAPEPAHLASLPSERWTDSRAERLDGPPHRSHPSMHRSLGDRIRTLLVVASAAMADWTEEWVMGAIGARFVEGQEPWKVWERAMKRKYNEMDRARVHNADQGQRSKEGDEGEDDWDMASSDSGSAPITGEFRQAAAPRDVGKERDWLDLGSVRYA